MFVCGYPGCLRKFGRKYHMQRHEAGHTASKIFECATCSKGFPRKDNMLLHEKTCGIRGNGIRREVRPPIPVPSTFKIVLTSTAFRNANLTWKLKYAANTPHNVTNLLDVSTMAMRNKLLTYQHKRRALKFNMSLHAIFEKATDARITTDPPAYFTTDQYELYEGTNIDELLAMCSIQLASCVESYEGTGSGWTLSKLVALDTTVWELDPLRGSTYHALPQWVMDTLSVVNVENHDEHCTL